jgi:hypothetical protein
MPSVISANDDKTIVVKNPNSPTTLKWKGMLLGPSVKRSMFLDSCENHESTCGMKRIITDLTKNVESSMFPYFSPYWNICGCSLIPTFF